MKYKINNMPWLEERTLTLFVRDTEVRRYEPGVRERGVDVEGPGATLMRPSDPDADADRALPLEAPVVHRHLIRQHPSAVYYPGLLLLQRSCPAQILSLRLNNNLAYILPIVFNLFIFFFLSHAQRRELFISLNNFRLFLPSKSGTGCTV